MKALAFLTCLLLVQSVSAQVSASLYAHWRTFPQGSTIPYSLLGNGFTTNWWDLKNTGARTDFTEIYAISNYFPAFPFSIIVDGQTYTGVESNALRFVDGTNLNYSESLDIIIPNGIGGPLYSNVLVAGWVAFSITNGSPTDSEFKDTTLVLDPTGINYCICQLDSDPSSVQTVKSHSDQNGTTAPSGSPISVGQSQILFRVTYRNGAAGVCRTKLFDSSLNFVGETMSAMGLTKSLTISFKAHYLQTPNGGTWDESPQFIMYNATDTDYTNVLNSVAQYQPAPFR